MRFDDRLLTVLNQPAGDRHDHAVRWRQLVDLVARAGPGGSGEVVSQALAAIRAEAPAVDESLRAAAARAVAARPLPLGLLEYFAGDKLAVSAPVLAAATLEPAQWRALLAVADDETRRFVETLHPEVNALPPMPAAQTPPARFEPSPAAEQAPPPRPAAPSLSDVVARIERRRRSREAQRGGTGAFAVPTGSPSLFRWECGPGGEISWVDGAPRGAVVGRSIARVHEDGDRVDEEVVRAFAMRAPFRDSALTVAGDGLLAGQWKISGIPAFEPTDGRFAGYRGVALRESPPQNESGGGISADLLADPDSLRELVHEIKTPLTAIIGFAEIIEGQYLGPADHQYRSRAAEIVCQARLLLRAIDDLDFAAKIHSSATAADRRADLGQLAEQVVQSTREAASAKEVELLVPDGAANAIAAIEPELGERLLVRLADAVIDGAERGEKLRLSIEPSGAQWRVAIARPAPLRNIPDRQLLEAAASGEPRSVAFALRLVRGLARIAGADLATSPAEFALLFPRA